MPVEPQSSASVELDHRGQPAPFQEGDVITVINGTGGELVNGDVHAVRRCYLLNHHPREWLVSTRYHGGVADGWYAARFVLSSHVRSCQEQVNTAYDRYWSVSTNALNHHLGIDMTVDSPIVDSPVVDDHIVNDLNRSVFSEDGTALSALDYIQEQLDELDDQNYRLDRGYIGQRVSFSGTETKMHKLLTMASKSETLAKRSAINGKYQNSVEHIRKAANMRAQAGALKMMEKSLHIIDHLVRQQEDE